MLFSPVTVVGKYHFETCETKASTVDTDMYLAITHYCDVTNYQTRIV